MHAYTALTYRTQQRWHSKQTNTARLARNRAFAHPAVAGGWRGSACGRHGLRAPALIGRPGGDSTHPGGAGTAVDPPRVRFRTLRARAHPALQPAFNPALLLSSDSCSDLGQSCAFIWQRAAAAVAAAGSALSAAQPSQSASWMTGHSASTRVRYVPREHSYGHFVRVQFAAQQRPDRNGPVWQEVGMPPTPCTRTHPHKAHMALTSRLIHSRAWSGRSAGDAIRYARDTPLTRTCRAAAVRTNTS